MTTVEQREISELRLALALVINERDDLRGALEEAERFYDSRRERDEVMRDVIADYDRRKAQWWGRFLLWLLRKTT